MGFNQLSLTWRGGEHDFALNIGELRALQQFCDAGPQEISVRLEMGLAKVDDIIQPLRLGLEGAGMAKATAASLINSAFDQYPLLDFVIPARAVLGAALYTVEDDEVGKQEAEGNPESGSSPHGTETAQ